MSKWKPTPMRRSLQPAAEGLETRRASQCGRRRPVPKGVPTHAATAVVRGTDPDGASGRCVSTGPAHSMWWVPVATFSLDDRNLQESIDTITVAGANTTSTRLVGTVFPNPDGEERKGFLPEPDRHAHRRAGQDRRGPGEQLQDGSERHSRHRHAQFLSGPYRDHEAEPSHRRSTRPPCRPGRSTFLRGCSRCVSAASTSTIRRRGRTPLNTTSKTTSFRSISACRSFRGRASSSTRSTATAKPIRLRRRRSRIMRRSWSPAG